MSAKKEDIFDEATELEERDDLKEGMVAEADPKSIMNDPMEAHNKPAVDVVKRSLDSQLTALGRETAKQLDQCPKHKVMIPMKELNPDDTFVLVGTNGWNMQIKRGEPVLLPDEIIERLAASGDAPTFVR